MQRATSSRVASGTPSDATSSPGAMVPSLNTRPRHLTLLSPAARKALRQRMLFLRQASVQKIAELAGASGPELKGFRHELAESDIPDLLLQRGAGLAFARELPQGGLMYLLVRALRPRRVIETGVRPGYSTVWLLAALEANGEGELTSLGPGPTTGRTPGVHDVGVGQFVPPSLRARWTLVLGNTVQHLQRILSTGGPVDLFFYDNGPDVMRARFELRSAWSSLSEHGVLLAHHLEASSAWSELCRTQGLAPQVLDAGPPPMGALSMRRASG